MKLKADIVIWDADGTLLNSTSLTWTVTELLLEALTGQRPSIRNAEDEHCHFGREALDRIAPGHGDGVWMMHRFGMRARARQVGLVPGIEAVVSRLNTRRQGIVTAALSSYVTEAIGPLATRFRFIRGHEHGTKRELLQALTMDGNAVYVGDTVRDINICRDLRIPIIGVGWGLDGLSALKAASADYVVNTPDELNDILL